jgi:hypothetical protein
VVGGQSSAEGGFIHHSPLTAWSVVSRLVVSQDAPRRHVIPPTKHERRASGHLPPLTTHRSPLTASAARPPGVAMDGSRAVCSSGAARWRIGREKTRVTEPLGRLVAESPRDPRPEKSQKCLGFIAGFLTGCLPHDVKVKAWSSNGSCSPWLLEHRRLSRGQRKGNRHTEYLPA